MSKLEATQLILEALSFAASKQAASSGKASRHDLLEPLALARILAVEGRISNERTLAAAILQSVLRQTRTKPAEIKKAFGPKIAQIVVEAARHNGIGRRVIANGVAKLSKPAKLIMLAENIATLRHMATAAPKQLSARSRRAYFEKTKLAGKPLKKAHKRLGKVFAKACRPKP